MSTDRPSRLDADSLAPLAVYHLNGLGDRLMALPAVRALAELFRGRLTLIGDHGDEDRLYRGLPQQQPIAAPDRLLRADTMLVEHRSFLSLNTWHFPHLDRFMEATPNLHFLGFFQEYDSHLPLDLGRHACDSYFAFGELFGPDLRMDDYLGAPVPSYSTMRAVSRLRSAWPKGRRILAVHTETKAPKMWPAARFRTVVREFLDRHEDYVAIVVDHRTDGVREERSDGRLLRYPHLPFPHAMLLVCCSDLFLGVDSCHLHVADLCGIPGVALFGPTEPERFGYRFAAGRNLGGSGSMKALGVDEVREALERLVAENRRPQRRAHDPLNELMTLLQADAESMRDLVALGGRSDRWQAWSRERGLEVTLAALETLLPARDGGSGDGRPSRSSRRHGEEPPGDGGPSRPGRFLRPLGETRFRETWWQQRPVSIAADPEREVPVSLADLDALLVAAGQSRSGQRLRWIRSGGDASREREEEAARCPLERVYELFNAGDSVLVTGCEASWSPFLRLTAEVGELFRGEATAEVLLMPARASAPLRSTSSDVFAHQLHGTSRWELSGGSDLWPVASGTLATEVKDERFREEQELSRGELLYVPRGWCFEITAGTGDPCLVAMIKVAPVTRLDLLHLALDLAAQRHSELRAEVTLIRAGFGDGGIGDELGACLKLVRSELDPRAVREAWERSRASRCRTPPDGHFQSLARLDEVSLDTWLERRSWMPPELDADGPWLDLRLGRAGLRAPHSARPALEHVVASHRFRPRDLPGRLSEAARLILGRRLVREGIARISDDQRP